jgi:thiamine kinase-like enzyme
MSEAGVGPKCLAEGENFRIEEFLPGRTLQRLELKGYATYLAKELNSFHKVRAGTSETPFIIHAIQSWSQLFLKQSELYLSDLNSDRKRLFDEVLWLTTPEAHAEVFSLLPRTGNHVICHNDISYMNILKHDTKFTIIDYEFADMNWASSDLAYYMNEVMYDYSVPNYPSFELCRQDDFTTAEMNEFIESYCVNDSILSEDMINEVIRMRPATNFMGALWAACNFLNEESEFDTLLYSKVRMNEYKRMREALI